MLGLIAHEIVLNTPFLLFLWLVLYYLRRARIVRQKNFFGLDHAGHVARSRWLRPKRLLNISHLWWVHRFSCLP